MKYAVYYRENKNDKVWKRSSETYRNAKGFLASRPRVFETKEEAINHCLNIYNDWEYETKIKELK